MFVYRFQYDDRNGVYNNGNFRRNLNRSIENYHKELDKINNMPFEIFDKFATKQTHPRFSKFIRDSFVFGFDSIEKFNMWFPEDLLRETLKEKSRYLKFCIFKVAKKNIVSDEAQCQFDPTQAKKIIECGMGCINFLKG